MMSMLWVVLFVALTGSHCGYGLPVRPTPQDYPLDGSTFPNWGVEGGLYAAIPVLALVVTAIVLLFGCTWCYRHKDCKPNEGTDNQIFTASAQHLQAGARAPPDSGFSEPANNNISEDNNNGPISLREMQNIANNNAAAYIVADNEERNVTGRESVVEFEPLPAALGGDPLERCADWFGGEDFPRNNLQYLREIGRGWFGRVVEGEIEEAGSSSTVAVKILNQNATLEDKARFLDESKIYRDVSHENVLGFLGKGLNEDPWILMFELCPMDLQHYLVVNRPKMAILNENGVPLQIMCDVTSALQYLHSQGWTYGGLWSGSVLVRDPEGAVRAVLGRYSYDEPQYDCLAPELRHGAPYTASSDIWSLGTLIWEVCSWGAPPTGRPSPPPELPCPYKSHLYQVMQLCWCEAASARPAAAQVHALVSHLRAAHAAHLAVPDTEDFEARWQTLKPNTIPKHDEHVAIVHAPSSRFSVDSPALEGGSRASSAMSDEPRKSESLTNLHGSLEDVRNIYLAHDEAAAADCHQGNTRLEDDRDRSDASVDPWLKEIIAGSQDDVSYYRDVSDVIKNLDNILNSEKTSSSESSHQASPSRDNLSLDCKKEYPVQSGLVKSPGITNFQNVADMGFAADVEEDRCSQEEEVDRDTIGTLSHSFERHSDTTSQQTLENLTPDTPMCDLEVEVNIERLITEAELSEIESHSKRAPTDKGSFETNKDLIEPEKSKYTDNNTESLKIVDCNIRRQKEANDTSSESDIEQLMNKDCETPCDIVKEKVEHETKSIGDLREVPADFMPLEVIEVTESVGDNEREETSVRATTASVDETTINDAVDTLPSVTEDVSTAQEHDTSLVRLEDIGPESMDSDNNYSKDETILISDLVDTITDSSIGHLGDGVKVQVEVDLEPVPAEQTPASVQNMIKKPCQESDLKRNKAESSVITLLELTPTHLPPDVVQNTDKHAAVHVIEQLVNREIAEDRTDNLDIKDSEADNAPRSDSLVDTGERAHGCSCHEDLINDTDSQIEKHSDLDNSSKLEEVKDSSSGIEPIEKSPLRNDSTEYLDLPSFDMIKKTSEFLQMEKVIAASHIPNQLASSTPLGSDKSDQLDFSGRGNEDEKTKIPLYESETSEQKYFENMSPFESPSHRSHRTDTYEDNSSVLGPFENLAPELPKVSKPIVDPVELPREELLAFSSNFSEINLETPSPLRDGNFLNEVPDITPDDQASLSEPKMESEATASGSGTQKRVSPSTPPNSPGACLLASQHKYSVDIDIEPEPIIDLNQIELQITSKLAMAENENNMNIEYSGPLTVEGLIEERGGMRDSDAAPEMFLAGNGRAFDEECVQALRNELELKLPLAQVANIEPALEAESEAAWGGELPPPPELVVSYPGALSPIQEETAPQLSAYENDTHWNPRTESSESYPEPCNNSTDSATSLPRGDTYTLRPRDSPPPATSAQITMSVDSLNGSPHKSRTEPIDDRTYKVEERTHTVDSCERLSQVSPCLVSPTADTDTTLPTDAKHSRPSDSKGLSKATSIDSWCSNDTLYNVEENLDELALEPEPEIDNEESAASDTIGNDQHSRCSTYIVHDGASERDSFSPDSIAENLTYTKPEVLPSDTDTRNTKDLAYGTLMSAMPSCSLEAGAEDVWRLQQPELIRRSPYQQPELTSPESARVENTDENEDPKLEERRFSRMDSVDITCLLERSVDSPKVGRSNDKIDPEHESPEHAHMQPCQTSTPLVQLDADSDVFLSPDAINTGRSPNGEVNGETQSIEHQFAGFVDIRNNMSSMQAREKESSVYSENSLDYNEFENVAASKPQERSSSDFKAISGCSFNSLISGSLKPGTSEKADPQSLVQNRPTNETDGEIRIPQVSAISTTSLTYSEFENSAADRSQDTTIFEHRTSNTDAENSADIKSQDNIVVYSSEIGNVSSSKSQERESIEQSPTYSEFENSAAGKFQDMTNTHAENFALKPQDNISECSPKNVSSCKSQERESIEQSPTYSEFENSAAGKFQDMTNTHAENFALKPQDNISECSPKNVSSSKSQDRLSIEQSPTYSEFEQSAAVESQNTTIVEQCTSNAKNAAAIKSQDNIVDCSSAIGNVSCSKSDDRLSIENSPTYSEFEQSAAVKSQNTTIVEHSTTVENCAIAKSQGNIAETSSTIGNGSSIKPEDILSIEHSPTYSEFEQSAAVKSQNTTIFEHSTSHTEADNSAATKLQADIVECRSVVENLCPSESQNKLSIEQSLTYSEFEHSAADKFQDVTSTYAENSATLKSQDNFSECITAIGNVSSSESHNPPSTKLSQTYTECEPLLSGTVIENSTTNIDIQNSTTASKPENQTITKCNPDNKIISECQDKSLTEKSSQSLESGISSEEFRSSENSLKSRPQNSNSLIDASSLLLYNERICSEPALIPPKVGQIQDCNLSDDARYPSQPVLPPPNVTNLIESHEITDAGEKSGGFLINFDLEETEQPHSIIVTEIAATSRVSPNRVKESHEEATFLDAFNSNRSKVFNANLLDFDLSETNGLSLDQPESMLLIDKSPDSENEYSVLLNGIQNLSAHNLPNGSMDVTRVQTLPSEIQINEGNEKFATVNFLNENFELLESSVDDNESREGKLIIDESAVPDISSDMEEVASPIENKLESAVPTESQETHVNRETAAEVKISSVTEDFLQNEKKYATLDSYFPLLSDIRFTGPASEMMSTSFRESPTSPECEQDSNKPHSVSDIMKEWDSDTDTHSTNSSSGEFIWKDGAGHETALVPSTHFDHHRGGGGDAAPEGGARATEDGASDSGSGDSGSGSEGDEVEFVPSSWDCQAAPAKSSLRSLESTPDSKKRVVFKRQKYHCVYEYPREAVDLQHSPACLPDLSTYCDWDPSSAEEAELCYGQLFSSPAPYPLRAAAVGADYDEDFFISSSARPFESGVMSSQFFPGAHKRALLERSLSDEGFPAPPPSQELDFTTPDSGVEDLTPASTLEFEPKDTWRPDGGEATSPSELGGLRHTRDRLKLDLPPSPHAASKPRVFSFRRDTLPTNDAPLVMTDTPLVMTDTPLVMTDTPLVMTDTPLVMSNTPLTVDDTPPPAPTFSTFGKERPRAEPDQRLVLTEATPPADSGDEDSGIESSSKPAPEHTDLSPATTS